MGKRAKGHIMQRVLCARALPSSSRSLVQARVLIRLLPLLQPRLFQTPLNVILLAGFYSSPNTFPNCSQLRITGKNAALMLQLAMARPTSPNGRDLNLNLRVGLRVDLTSSFVVSSIKTEAAPPFTTTPTFTSLHFPSSPCTSLYLPLCLPVCLPPCASLRLPPPFFASLHLLMPSDFCCLARLSDFLVSVLDLFRIIWHQGILPCSVGTTHNC
mmetsp:Transcript_52105/g.86384  ORF Transcript_52105/g.86384 Transcript_52105/m.86384 type:complete len:214 (-) Transcript_52105:247-888(-)